jgi:carbohydrate esterase-like sialic acid-specific acetylesterase
MRSFAPLFFALALIACSPLPPESEATVDSGPPPLKVFILAGQSNMVGAGTVAADPNRNDGKGTLAYLVESPATAGSYAHLVDGEGTWKAREDVWISYFEREGQLSVGYGSNEGTIGPELGFGQIVGDAMSEPVLLIKVAWGGKSIGADFRPPSAGGEVGASYRDLFAQVHAVLGSIDERFPEIEHTGYELLGIGWHQGWNDRVNQAFNDAYEENLSCFIRDARKELGIPDLPFVIAETGMSGHEETHPRALSLMAAQVAVAQRKEFHGTVAFVGTRDFYRPKEESPSGQAYHWNNNAETYYLIGSGMGVAMLELLQAN